MHMSSFLEATARHDDPRELCTPQRLVFVQILWSVAEKTPHGTRTVALLQMRGCLATAVLSRIIGACGAVVEMKHGLVRLTTNQL